MRVSDFELPSGFGTDVSPGWATDRQLRVKILGAGHAHAYGEHELVTTDGDGFAKVGTKRSLSKLAAAMQVDGGAAYGPVPDNLILAAVFYADSISSFRRVQGFLLDAPMGGLSKLRRGQGGATAVGKSHPTIC